MVRCMPQKARARLLSLAGCTEMAPSWTSYAMSSTTGMLSVPLGPFTDSVPSAIEAVTPDGTEIGFFPIRDMGAGSRSEEHTSELQSLMRISYAVFCLKKKNNQNMTNYENDTSD